MNQHEENVGPLDSNEQRAVQDMQEATATYLSEREQTQNLPWWQTVRLRYVTRQASQRLVRKHEQQRIERGYSWLDVIDGTSHILLVIAGIAEELRNQEVDEYPPDLDFVVTDENPLDVWRETLYTITLGCRRYALCLQYPDYISGAEMQWAEEECNHSMTLFFDWWKWFFREP